MFEKMAPMQRNTKVMKRNNRRERGKHGKENRKGLVNELTKLARNRNSGCGTSRG